MLDPRPPHGAMTSAASALTTFTGGLWPAALAVCLVAVVLTVCAIAITHLAHADHRGAALNFVRDILLARRRSTRRRRRRRVKSDVDEPDG